MNAQHVVSTSPIPTVRRHDVVAAAAAASDGDDDDNISLLL